MDLLQGIKAPCQSNLDGTTGQLFLTLINMLMAAQCPLGSKDQYPKDYGPKLVDKEEFDFIIVGAGSSGSVVANKLSENPNWRILVLEAGGYPSATSEVPGLLFSLQNTEEDWQYRTETSTSSCQAYKDKQCSWPRGKVLGGSSTINAMIYNRGNSRDYDDWEKMGNPGWSYKDLEEHFKKIENLQVLANTTFYGKHGFQSLSWYYNNEPITNSIAEGATQFGYPALLEQDPKKPMGFYQCLFTTEKGTRMNAAKAFIGQVKVRNNLFIATSAYVRKVLGTFSDSSFTANGVEVQVGEQLLNIAARKEVVLSAGALNTPKILMHSGIGPQKDLEKLGVEVVKNLPGVGQNLQDHVILPLFFKIDESAYNKRPQGYLLNDLYSYFMYRTGPTATIHITNLIGFINTKNDSLYPNIQLQHVGHLKNDQYLLPLAYKSFGFTDESLLELIKINQEHELINIIPVLLNPKSRGRIELKSTDFLEKPKFHAGYFSDENGEDVKTILESIRFVQNLLRTAPMQKHQPEHVKLTLPDCVGLPYDSDDYWYCYIRHFSTTIYHQVGTCKMGPRLDNMAVVDERLKLYGVKHLRVIDASIMPKIVSANTHAACLAIGHKGGEMILEDWKEKNTAHDEF